MAWYRSASCSLRLGGEQTVTTSNEQISVVFFNVTLHPESISVGSTTVERYVKTSKHGKVGAVKIFLNK